MSRTFIAVASVAALLAFGGMARAQDPSTPVATDT